MFCFRARTTVRGQKSSCHVAILQATRQLKTHRKIQRIELIFVKHGFVESPACLTTASCAILTIRRRFSPFGGDATSTLKQRFATPVRFCPKKANLFFSFVISMELGVTFKPQSQEYILVSLRFAFKISDKNTFKFKLEGKCHWAHTQKSATRLLDTAGFLFCFAQCCLFFFIRKLYHLYITLFQRNFKSC